MSRHFSIDVLLEMAETGKSHPHLTQCSRCGQQMEEAREALHLAREVEVPEPSPLFWDHLSTRVHDAVQAEEPLAEGASRRRLPGLAWRHVAYATLALVLVAAGVWRIESVRRAAALRSASVHTNAALVVSNAASIDTTSESSQASVEASWSLITDAAANVDLDTATQTGGFALQPGAAERAALQLTPEERRELVRLLRTAVERPE